MNATTKSTVVPLAIISVAGVDIAMDQAGRFCLNDLHKASGNEARHQPAQFLRLDQTGALVTELGAELGDMGNPISVIRGGQAQGTYVCKELVYAYAMWISTKFHLQVIRTFDAVATGQIAAPAKRARRATPSLMSDIRVIDFIGNMVAKSPGARLDVVVAVKLRLIEEHTGIKATQFGGALPAEALDQAVKLNPTEIGKRFLPKISPVRINKMLIDMGVQRKSESGYVLTEAGAAHGESRPFQAGNKHVGGQINWYESVVELVRGALSAQDQNALGFDASNDEAEAA